MKKGIISFISGGMFGLFTGFAVGIFIYPYIFLTDIVATEQVNDTSNKRVVAKGEFIHANPNDPIHYGSGNVTVYNDVVFLEDSFQVGPGPAYHVYLVPDQNITTHTNVAETMFIDLGRLRAFKGSQVYPVPAGVNLSDYGSVVIWCKHFGVLISPARLNFTES